MREVLGFVRELLAEARQAHHTSYGDGFIDSLEQVEEWIADTMWDRGEDVSE